MGRKMVNLLNLILRLEPTHCLDRFGGYSLRILPIEHRAKQVRPLFQQAFI